MAGFKVTYEIVTEESPRTGWTPDEFTRGAIEAAFFTCDPFISSGEYEMDWSNWNDRLSPADRARFVQACQAFQDRYPALLARACEATGNDLQHAGRDYHYSSAGHGCGFWDGDWKGTVTLAGQTHDWGDLLDQACKRHPLPELHADVDCEGYRQGRGACNDCDGCEAGAQYYL